MIVDTMSRSDGQDEKNLDQQVVSSINCQNLNLNMENGINVINGHHKRELSRLQKLGQLDNNNGQHRGRQRRRRLRCCRAESSFGYLASKLIRWLPFLKLTLLVQQLTSPINCDDGYYPLDVMQTDFEAPTADQSSQQENPHQFKYLQQAMHSSPQVSHSSFIESSNNQQMQDNAGALNRLLVSLNMLPMMHNLDQDRQHPRQYSDQRQQQLVANRQISNSIESDKQRQNPDDLLDSQSSATNAARSNPSASTSSTSESASKPAQSSPESSSSQSDTTSSSSSNSGPSVNQHLSAVANLLHQIGIAEAAGQSIANALASDKPESISEATVSNSISHEPVRSSSQLTNNIGTQNVARNPNANADGGSSRRPGTVGQSINGNIEYDSNQNSINGFIDLPFNLPFGLGNNSNSGGGKPSFSAQIKPLVWTALKTVPIKLGTVGWKLLQLIAWKKVYKTHHPKSGEIIFEQEMAMPSKKSRGKGMYSGKKDAPMSNVHMKNADYDHMEKSIDHGIKSMFKSAKMGQGYGPPMMMHPVHQQQLMGPSHYGGGWPYGPMMDYHQGGSPLSSASMIYQRHLLPASIGHTNPGNPTNPAAAAAAAAAATAAAIQSQWAQSQLGVQDEAEQMAAVGRASQNNSSTMSSAASGRKRSLIGGSNWFASPAHAYTFAAANAAAATAAAVSEQHHHQMHPNRFGIGDQAGGGGQLHGENYQQALTGLMYQNLFDNAAAMAVQNAVKLPATQSLHPFGDYLNSASDSMLSLGGTSPLSSSAASSLTDIETAWPTENMLNQHSDMSGLGHQGAMSDSMMGLNENPSLMTDFDDTPAGKYIGDALNETYSR